MEYINEPELKELLESEGFNFNADDFQEVAKNYGFKYIGGYTYQLTKVSQELEL